ncbi:MAG: DUF2079 domain-containing protein [Candidatus Gracilibacteria bacterium]|nr:DUF2079 domain-containing protein [Candidatus Gracilibacteria bacterium]
MGKIIISFLLASFVLGYCLIDTTYTLYYFQLKAAILSITTAILIYFFSKNKSVFSIGKHALLRINPFIDRYGIYFLLGGFFLLLNFLTFSKHLNFHSSGFDLGIFDQVVYKYSNGVFPASSSIREISNIEGDHFHPILGLYALFYKIYASPLTLIFIQNLAFILGGLGIYKIAKYKLNIPIIGFGVVFLYLIFKGNINALFFDFHPIVVAVSLFPWLFYYSIKKKWLIYFLLLIPILLSKENLSLYIVFFGIYQFFIQKEKTVGLITFVIGITYFYLSMNIFLPAMGGGGKYWSYDLIGENPKDFIMNTFLHPIQFIQVLFDSIKKVSTYLHHLGSGGYLLFTPIIIFLIPSYAQKFLSSREEFWTLNFHYSIDVYWVIALGIIFSFAYIRKRFPQKHIDIYIFLGVFIFCNSFIINLHNSKLLQLSYKLENLNTLKQVMNTLPKNISISTQNNIVPHFSHNNDVFIFPNLGDAEYILLNTKISSGWPLNPGESLDMYMTKLNNKEPFKDIKLPFIKEPLYFNTNYDLIIEENNVFLYKKTITND